MNDQNQSSVPKQTLGQRPNALSSRLGGVALAKPRRWWRRLNRKQAGLGATVAIIIIGAGLAFALTRHKPPAPVQAVAAIAKPKPAPIVSPLTGLPVTSAETKLPITGVMIENTPWARPQSGLGSAGVVYEAVAEAGITRFLALYQESQPQNLGPVRSARPYFLQWALGFDASLAHVGGSPEALNDINAWHVKNLDQFYNSAAFHRISARFAPHNMYTSIPGLRGVEKSHGFVHSHFASFPRKKDAPSAHPSVKSIDMNPSYPDYAVHYAYSAKSNSYRRFEGGSPHIDANTNKQISPKVVIAIIVPYRLEADGYHSSYSAIGSGPVYVFQDGGLQRGTWHKKSLTGQLTFLDAQHRPLKFNAGQTWITALSSPSQLGYKL